MVDVFISYKQEDREAVVVVAVALADLKLDVWFDTKLRAGTSFDAEIATALGDARAVLVCWTPAAMKSEWVRAEASKGREDDRLVACFLAPTNLNPPFNLVHAENLSAWAGQTDDAAWTNLLDRIGRLTNRPGLARYYAVMRTGASIAEMEAWAKANGDDPLVDGVWARIALLQGEGAEARLAREKAEARALADNRRAQAEKSRRLARERGLRDPARERRRYWLLAGTLAATFLIVIGAIAYFNDEQERERRLRDEVTTTATARSFIAANAWHPISRLAREKFLRLDSEAWLTARTNGSIKSLEAYLADAQGEPRGQYLANAQTMLATARRVRDVQAILARMRLYDGEISGTNDLATQNAIVLFRYRHGLPVSNEIDSVLVSKLDGALVWWTRPRLEELRAQSREAPTEADYVRFAKGLRVNAATIKAVIEEVAGRASTGLLPDGRMVIRFERHYFSKFTNGKYDDTYPDISNPTFDVRSSKYGAPEYERLAAAYALDPEAALKSTSWGSLQIMGYHHERNGFATVGEFVRFMSQSQASQLEAGILGFIRTDQGLLDAVRRHDWVSFLAGFGENRDHAGRLAERYQRIEKEMAAQMTPGGDK